MEPSSELRNLVLGLYHDWEKDDDSFIDNFVSDRDEVLGIGTDPDEWWRTGQGFKAIWHKQFEEGIGGRHWIPGDLLAYSEGSVGWVVDNPTITEPDGSTLEWRITIVFHREQGLWKLVHVHVSQGVPNTIPLTTSIDDVADMVSHERPRLDPALAPDGTVTIMFTDIEESTATNEAIGDDRFLPLLLEHNNIVRRQTESLGGTVVKSAGDGFMLAFPSARRGVECGIAVQRDVSALDERIKVRMGLHTGEPVRHKDDFFGRDVAYAARIGSSARGGEILISTLVKSLVEPSGSFRFDGPRQLEFKGFDGPQQVFAVAWAL